MYDVIPCPTCQTRSIRYNGIHWTCECCHGHDEDPTQAVRLRVLGQVEEKLGPHMSKETIKTLLEGIE